MKLFWIVVVLAVCLWVAVGAVGAPTYPKRTGHVNDLADLLSDQQRSELARHLRLYEQEYRIDLALATVTSLNGQAPEDYAVELANLWTTGSNWVLLLVAPNERQMYIRMGDGFPSDFCSALVRRVIDETMIPLFKEGRMDEGILRGIDVLAGEIATHLYPDRPYLSLSQPIQSASPSPLDSSLPSWQIIVGLVVFIMALGVLTSGLRKRR